jgi:hypothetical protein
MAKRRLPLTFPPKKKPGCGSGCTTLARSIIS